MFANYVLNDYVKWKQFGRVNRIVLDLLPLHSALFWYFMFFSFFFFFFFVDGLVHRWWWNWNSNAIAFVKIES